MPAAGVVRDAGRNTYCTNHTNSERKGRDEELVQAEDGREGKVIASHMI